MNPTQNYIDAFRRIVDFQIKLKSNSRAQKILAFLVRWYIPTYLTNYTTVIGKSIYFPDQRLLDRPHARFTIAHEVVHLLDQQRLTAPLFVLLYLSPQIFALGVLSFPWLGWHALWFLIFALPWPSPGRAYIEARAYGLEMYLLTNCEYQYDPKNFIRPFVSSDYYFMSWSRSRSEKRLAKYFQLAQLREDPIFEKVIQTFNECDQNSAA